jgi:hypothetical protein
VIYGRAAAASFNPFYCAINIIIINNQIGKIVPRQFLM